MPVLSVLANRTANRKGWKLSSEGVGGGGGGGGFPAMGGRALFRLSILASFQKLVLVIPLSGNDVTTSSLWHSKHSPTASGRKIYIKFSSQLTHRPLDSPG